MVLAALASLEEQGQYALASNYGGLVARMVFQPLEESSRNVLGKLTASDNGAASHLEKVATAKAYLSDILHSYGIFSILACIGGPVAIPPAIKIIMGRHWTSPEMLELLLAYCYYIPFLAFNGITEAFVSSTANNTELRRQTGWMTAFSVAFAAAVYFFLGVCELGAVGLVWANMANMALRITWSHWFIKRYFRTHGIEFNTAEALPSLWTLAAGVLVYASLATIRPSIESGMVDMARPIGIAMIAGISV
jgi:oligosaccharide translocation protein RFT1